MNWNEFHWPKMWWQKGGQLLWKHRFLSVVTLDSEKICSFYSSILGVFDSYKVKQ